MSTINSERLQRLVKLVLTAEERRKYSRSARSLGICGWYLEPPTGKGRRICKLDAGHRGIPHE